MKHKIPTLFTRTSLILMLCFCGAMALVRSVNSEAPPSMKDGKEPTQLFNVGTGAHTASFRLGRETHTSYLGAASLQQAMQVGQARPLSMVADDFNGDGMSDLVVGYANKGGGVLSLRQGNLEAIAPQDPAVFQGLKENRYPAPFSQKATLLALPEAPDFLQVGDFDADGYMDVLAAARGGSNLYLLPGDGHGKFKAIQQIGLLGQINSMQSDDFKQAGRLTTVALGVMAPDGPQVAVYNEANKGLQGGSPDAFQMPAEVTALAFGQLDGDGIADLAAAAGSEVFVLHGSDQASNNSSTELNAQQAARIERASFPFVIKGLVTGDFIFDRGHQTELALLSDDGTVYFSDRGTPDTRPFTAEEKAQIRQQKIAVERGEQSMESLTALTNSMVRRSSKGNAEWNIEKVINTGVTPAFANSSQAVLKAARVSDFPTEDLLVGDASGKTVNVLRNTEDAQKLQARGGEMLDATSAVKTGGTPLAVLALRLSVDTRPDLVVLNEGDTEPLFTLNVANATYNVNTTADLADDNFNDGVCHTSSNNCSLRAAITTSNHVGGSNIINVPVGTYTLTIGPFDDNVQFGGAVEESGDLDILNEGPSNNPVTGVSLVGTNVATTIIQMGTLSPVDRGINKDRVLEVNNFATVQSKINVVISNMTIQNGVAPKIPNGASFTNEAGGGIRYDGSDANANTNIGLLTLTNCRINANTGTGQGGGVLAGFGSLLVQTGSVFTANNSLLAAGGGIQYSGGNTVETQTLKIDGSTIGGPNAADGNQAQDVTAGNGGGVQGVGGAGVTISNGTIIQNNKSLETGGAIGGGGVAFVNSPLIAISNTTISNNTAKNHGGGLWSSARNAVTNAASTITLTSDTIQNNQADSDASGAGDGGGIYSLFGNMTLNNTSSGSLSGNSAVNGGGIFTTFNGNSVDPSASLTVTTGTVITTNTAKNNGGGLAVSPGAATTFGTISVTGATISSNTANSDSTGGGDGGGIFVGSGNLNPLSGVTIDSNVANSGSGDGIYQTGGTLTATGTLNLNGGDSISLTGGTFTSTSGTVNISGNFLNSGATFNNGGGTFNFNGSSAQTIGGTTAMTFNNLTINNSSGGVSLGNNETVSAALTLTSGALGVGSNTLTLNGAVSASGGSLTSNANGTVNYNQQSAGQNVLAANYGNLTFSNFSKTLASSGTIQIRGTFTPGTAASHTITGSTVEFNGAAAQTLPSGFTTYNNLTLNNAAGVTGFSGLTVNSLLRVQQGTFTSNNGTYKDVQIDSGATLAGVNATTINVSGNWTNNGTFTANTNTVNFNGAAAQTLGGSSNSNFNNLTINNAAGVTLGSNQTVNGTLTLTNGALNVAANTLTLNSTVTITSGTIGSATGGTVNYNQGSNGQNVAPGSYDNLTFSNFNKTLPASTVNISGTFTPGSATGHTVTGNTINFNGAGAQTIPAFTYNNLTSSNVGARTLASSGNIRIAGTFTPGTNAYTITGSTIEFNGSTAQTIPAFNYFNLTSSNVGARTLASSGNIRIAGTFTPGTNAYTVTGSTIEYNGTAAQTLPATFTPYNNLTINNAAGVTLAGSPTVNGALTFTNGNLTTGTQTLTVAGTGTAGTHTAGYVIGNLLKTYSAVTTFRYDVGTASGYAPVTAQVTAGTGNLTVAAKQPKQPNIVGTEALQRYWTLTGSGITANLTFQYNAADVVGNESLYQVLKYNGSTFTAPTPQSVDTSNHRGTVNNVTSFSDWTLAEPGATFGRFGFNNPATFSGNENAGTITVTVNRNGGTSGSTTVDYSTVAGGTATGGASCATSGVDYINTNGTLTFANGDTSKTFNITVCNDNVREGDETINVAVTNPQGGASLDTVTSAVTTIVDDDPLPTITINNVNTLEPDTGTGIAVFTVTLSNPSTSVVTVNYATQDGTATAPADYVAITSTPLTFNALETSKTVNVTINADAIPEPAETFDLVLSGVVNGMLPEGTKGTATILPPVPNGNMLISEFRLRGTAGVNDEFIELYNNSGSSITVATSDGTLGWVVAAADGTPRFTIPAGTVLPARSHYLGANNSAGGYSLGSYPAGNGTTATPNATYALDIPESSGIALFKTTLPANFTQTFTLDAVGFAATAPPYSESSTLTPPNANGEYSFVRKFASATGLPQDTNNNAADFAFISTDGTAFGTNVSYGLGAPGPENLSSPTIKDRAQIPGSLVDPAQCQGCTPNRVRDATPDVPNNSTFGTLNIRRAFTNMTGAPITRLRFRVIDITTLNSPGGGPVSGQADLRLRTSGNSTVSVTGGGSVNVQGVTLETPPAQAMGGGLNSTVSAGTITTAAPLNNGATINLQFLLGVQKSGTFSFFLNVEALP